MLAIYYDIMISTSKICNLTWTKFILQIGSSPGFEDGEFGSAKLLRPAGSFYCTAENCLYFVDSEV